MDERGTVGLICDCGAPAIDCARDAHAWQNQVRAKVSMMRELGIMQMDGMIIGPPVPKAVALQHALEQKPEDPQLNQELAEAVRAERIDAERQRLIDLLGRDLRPGEFERMHDPARVDPK